MNLVIITIFIIVLVLVLVLFGINCNKKNTGIDNKEEFYNLPVFNYNDWEHFVNKKVYIKTKSSSGGAIQWSSAKNKSGDHNIKIDGSGSPDWVKLIHKRGNSFTIKSSKGTLTTGFPGSGIFYSMFFNWLTWNGKRVNLKGAAFCPHRSLTDAAATFYLHGNPRNFVITNINGSATVWKQHFVKSRVKPWTSLGNNESGLYFANVDKNNATRFYITNSEKTYLPINNGYCDNSRKWSIYSRGRNEKKWCEINHYKSLFDKNRTGDEKCIPRKPNNNNENRPLYPTLTECKKKNKNWKLNRNTKQCYSENNVEGTFYTEDECKHGSLNWDYDTVNKQCVKYPGQIKKYIDRDECETKHKNWGLNDIGVCEEHKNKLKDYYTKESCERNEKNTFYDPVKEKCITTERVKQPYYTKSKECEKKHKNWYVKDEGELSAMCVNAPGEHKSYYTEQQCKDKNKNMYIKDYQCLTSDKEADYYNEKQCLTAKRYWVFKDGDCIKNDGVVGDYFTQDECYENNKLFYKL
jgi:hypothetical protein